MKEVIDREKLYEALVEGFIHREYQVMYPQLTADYFKRAVVHYQSNPVFHARVQSVVSSVMVLIDKNIRYE